MGENHHYTKRDYDDAKRLVSEHEYFASESGDSGCVGMSFGVSFTLNATRIAKTIPTFFYTLGSGRMFDSAARLAKKEGNKIYSLEGCSTANISSGEHIRRLTISIPQNLLAPVYYYDAQEEGLFDPDSCTESSVSASLPKRDLLQAEGIVRLLETEDVNNLLATVGLCHLDGVMRNLHNQLELQEIK